MTATLLPPPLLILLPASCFFSSDKDVVGIDEAQFFDEGLVDVCNKLADNGIRVIVAGLDVYKRQPFHMPFLLSFFRAFSHNSIRQDMTFRKKSDDLF